MKLFLFLLFLPTVLASSLAVHPLEVTDEFIIYNPNNHEINFQIKSENIEVNLNNGTIQNNSKQLIEITNNEEGILLIESSSKTNTLNPAIAIKVKPNSMISEEGIGYTIIVGTIIVIFLVWLLIKIN